MGIMPDPGTYNNHCPRCWPVDGTPELLKCFISGIEYNHIGFPGLPPPPNEYVDLHQTAIGCEWVGGGDKAWRVILNFTPVDTQITVEVARDIFAFVESPHELCKFHFTNFRQNPAIFAYNFGWAFVCTPAEMQSWIEMVTPVTGPDPRMELFAMADDKVVLKFCNIQDGTNIKIKIDTTLL